MPSYTQYKRQMAVLDADDSEIESWITVRGNHIPIMKGQSKGDAVKAFIEKKSGSGGAKSSTKKEYDPDFETVRKNAKANHYLYGGKYTQRSKQAAYKEYKHDTSSEENLRAANKWVNSELVAKKEYNPDYETLKKELAAVGGERNLGVLGAAEQERRGLIQEYNDLFEESKKLKSAIKSEVDLVKRNELKAQLKEVKNKMENNNSESKNITEKAVSVWNEGKKKESKPSDSMGRPPKKKYEGQTLGEMEKGGANVSELRQDLNRWYYGFYVEEARKMTPQQLVDRMEDMLATSTGRVNHGEVKIQEVFPDLIKKVKEHIKNMGAGKPIHKDLDRMLQSVMAYGGHGMSPEDILASNYHGYFLKDYVNKYGKDTVKNAIKEMQSKIDHIEHDVHTDSEGVSYNSIVWKDSPDHESKNKH